MIKADLYGKLSVGMWEPLEDIVVYTRAIEAVANSSFPLLK